MGRRFSKAQLATIKKILVLNGALMLFLLASYGVGFLVLTQAFQPTGTAYRLNARAWVAVNQMFYVLFWIEVPLVVVSTWGEHGVFTRFHQRAFQFKRLLDKDSPERRYFNEILVKLGLAALLVLTIAYISFKTLLFPNATPEGSNLLVTGQGYYTFILIMSVLLLCFLFAWTSGGVLLVHDYLDVKRLETSLFGKPPGNGEVNGKDSDKSKSQAKVPATKKGETERQPGDETPPARRLTPEERHARKIQEIREKREAKRQRKLAKIKAKRDKILLEAREKRAKKNKSRKQRRAEKRKREKLKLYAKYEKEELAKLEDGEDQTGETGGAPEDSKAYVEDEFDFT